MNKKNIFIVLLFFSLISALVVFSSTGKTKPALEQLLPPKETIEILEEHHDDAIIIGKGPRPYYVFVDPLCEMSQMFMRLIYNRNNTMLKNYTIYIYLYKLPDKDSTNQIVAILNSDDRERMLKEAMLNEYKFPTSPMHSDTKDQMIRIEKMGEKIGVYKRPYMITDGIVMKGGE